MIIAGIQSIRYLQWWVLTVPIHKTTRSFNRYVPNHRVSRLLDSLSLSSGSSKLTKLFHHSSSSSTSKKLNPTMQYLLQAGPQGLLRIWPTALSEEMNYCSFMVNMTTTSAEIIKLVFEKYELVDDPRRFYVCEMGLGKGGKPFWNYIFICRSFFTVWNLE